MLEPQNEHFVRDFLTCSHFLATKSTFSCEFSHAPLDLLRQNRCAALPSIFNTSPKMPRLPWNLRAATAWRALAMRFAKSTYNTTRRKCCTCHAKWRWRSPKCFAGEPSFKHTKVMLIPSYCGHHPQFRRFLLAQTPMFIRMLMHESPIFHSVYFFGIPHCLPKYTEALPWVVQAGPHWCGDVFLNDQTTQNVATSAAWPSCVFAGISDGSNGSESSMDKNLCVHIKICE